MPVLVAEWSNIHKELEVLHFGSSHHIHLLIHLGAYHVIEHTRELVKLLVSLFRGHTLVACLEPEVHCGVEARHIGESRAYIHPFFYYRHRQVETYAICSERYAQFYIILCHRHIRGHDCCCKNSNNSFHTLLYIIIFSVAKLRIIIETPKKISKNFTFLSRKREFYA